jgi:acetolactate synthase-1/2/3 large subunit
VIPAIDKAMAYNGPFLIDFGIEPEENVYPFVPPGASLEEFLEIPDKKKEEALWQRQNTH